MPNGDFRPLTPRLVCIVVGVPVLMTLVCVGLFALRRFLDREDEHHDA
jgi:hypothetical protein